jgi:hypothetical protein
VNFSVDLIFSAALPIWLWDVPEVKWAADA